MYKISFKNPGQNKLESGLVKNGNLCSFYRNVLKFGTNHHQCIDVMSIKFENQSCC